MKILVAGSGGRAHAWCWKLSESAHVTKIYAAPGNPGTRELSKTSNIPIAATDIADLAEFAQWEKIDITIPDSEETLALGITDHFRKNNLCVFGPTKKAAQMETSKAFAKRFFRRHAIRTAKAHIFHAYEKAREVISRHWRNSESKETSPLVIKADGLAQGKGTSICYTEEQALGAIRRLMLEKKYAQSGECVIVEQFLRGQEASLFAFTDGTMSVPLISARDYKPLSPADPEKNQPAGPNTGGMGAYAPIPEIDSGKQSLMHERITKRILEGLRKEEMPFFGCIYPGIMMRNDGEDDVVECNARMGDPEAQAIYPQMESDLALTLIAYKEGRMGSVCMEWKKGYAVCVVLVSQGYPEKPKKIGVPIYGIKDAEKIPGVVLFHAGTRYEESQLVTSGGRVLGVTAHGDTLLEAASRAYEAVGCISFENMYYRKDIGRTG